MRSARLFLPLAVLAAACTDDVPSPTGESQPPVASAISDGGHGGEYENFFFLPPLVKGNSVTGDFQPFLQPAVEVCQLTGPDGTCDAPVGRIAYFGPGSVTTGVDQYQVNWDTNDPSQLEEGATLQGDTYYRISALLGDRTLGFLDVFLADPNGTTPSVDIPGTYSGNLGETLPIKFFVGNGILCEIGSILPNGEVAECTETLIFRELGATVKLEGSTTGPTMGFYVPPEALSVEDPVIAVKLERIALDPGETCIPELDVPTFGPCMRITTIPEQFNAETSAELPIIFGLCVNPSDLEPFVADPASVLNAQMFRKPESYGARGVSIEALANVSTPAGFCPTIGSGAQEVQNGILGSIARLFRPVSQMVVAQPLHAIHLGRGGEESEMLEMSWYTWGLPLQLSATRSASYYGDAGDPVVPLPQVRALDDSGLPVQGARVRFNVTAGNGTVVPEANLPLEYPEVFEDLNQFVYTDSDGYAEVQWTLGDEGANTLRAYGHGFFGENDTFVPHEQPWSVGFGETVFNATACTPGSGGTGPDANLGSANYGSAGDIDGVLGAEWACAMQRPYSFEANVGSGTAAAEVYWMNDDQYLYLALKVEGQSKVNGLRFDFDNDADAIPEEFNDAFSFDPGDPDVAGDEVQSDEYLSAKCLNKSQSGCGDRDEDAKPAGANDGFAAFTLENGVTIYELRKPLQGDQYDFNLSAGDKLLWFGTLRAGNGAKGNTQFPQFRDWWEITIAGGGS